MWKPDRYPALMGVVKRVCVVYSFLCELKEKAFANYEKPTVYMFRGDKHLPLMVETRASVRLKLNRLYFCSQVKQQKRWFSFYDKARSVWYSRHDTWVWHRSPIKLMTNLLW